MKKTVFILALATFTLVGFNNCQAKKENSSENGVPGNSVTQNEGGSVKLTKATFLEEVWDYENSPQEWKYKGDKPALVDFYADWCGPCRKAAPILEEISKEYAGQIHVYKIDTQKERELASVFGIKGIPAFLYIPVEGKPVMMSGIGRTDEATKNMFKANIGKYLLTSN
jgi:thioredoxin